MSIETISKLESKLSLSLGFDLRTLLNGFAGPIQLLKQKVDDPSLVDIFRLIDSSLSRLDRLSKRSQLISSMQSGIPIVTKNNVNIIDIAKYSVLELQTLSDLEGLSVNVDTTINSIELKGDSDLLINVFEILLETIISLSSENSLIFFQFSQDQKNTSCIISSSSANLPDINEDVSWDLLMAKELLRLHNATIGVINDNQRGYFEIIFKNVSG